MELLVRQLLTDQPAQVSLLKDCQGDLPDYVRWALGQDTAQPGSRKAF